MSHGHRSIPTLANVHAAAFICGRVTPAGVFVPDRAYGHIPCMVYVRFSLSERVDDADTPVLAGSACREYGEPLFTGPLSTRRQCPHLRRTGPYYGAFRTKLACRARSRRAHGPYLPKETVMNQRPCLQDLLAVHTKPPPSVPSDAGGLRGGSYLGDTNTLGRYATSRSYWLSQPNRSFRSVLVFRRHRA